MTDSVALIAAGAVLLALALGAAAFLNAWHGWLELKRGQLHAGPDRPPASEVAQLRARVRKLEQIATGLD